MSTSPQSTMLVEPGTATPIASPAIADRETPLAVVMLLGGLHVGGAERQAIAMAGALHARGHRITIVALEDGPLRASIESLGVPLEVIHRPLHFSPAAIPVFARVLETLRPDIVYAFLDVQWLVALGARRMMPGARIVLGLRSSQYQAAVHGVRDRAVHWLTRQLSQHADLVIANSAAGLDDFAMHAVRLPKGLVVPNGIDTAQFVVDPVGRGRVRAEWHISDDDILVGHVGRLDPVKDHELLLDAFARVAARDARWRLVCVGDGTPERFTSLRARAAQLGIAERVKFAGRRSDLAAVYSALDLSALCSLREGFPNVVAESMMCGTPAVVTDAGASAEIVGTLGEVVPVGDVAAFAAALERMAARRSTTLSMACQARVVADFTLDQCAERTIAAFRSLLQTTVGR